jgi:hypothetical protein
LTRLNYNRSMPTNRRITGGGGGGQTPKKPRGISNAQAKKLGKLKRELDEPYNGQGMTAVEAHYAIDDALARLGRRSKTSKALKRSRRLARRAQRQTVEES